MIKMGFKDWWNKQNYWKKGAIIGFIVSIILMFIILPDTFHTKFYDRLEVSIHYPICFISIPLGDSGHPPFCIFTIFITPFIYAIIGALIGLLIEKTNKK